MFSLNLWKLSSGVIGVACAMVVWTAASPVRGQCVPSPSHLISWWPGDLDGTDIVGGNLAVLLGGTIAGAPGMVGGAWDFDGVDGYARVADSPAVSIENGDGTWLAWVLPRQADTTLNYRQVIFDKETSLNGGVFLYLQGNALHFYNGSPQAGQLPIQNGVWYFIAVVKDGSIGRTYVNGALDMTFSWLPYSGGQDLGIGGDTLGTAQDPQRPLRRFDGKIDEAMIFNRALLPVEIADIYAAGSAGVCVATDDDCDGNGVPDEIDIAGGVPDCNVNGIPDVCEQFPTILAENTTGFPDSTFTGPPDDFFIGIGGQIVTYDFGDIVVVDGDGPDFNVYEVDRGVAEFAIIDVLVSVDGTSYISVKDTEGPVVRIPGDELHTSGVFARSYDLGAIIPNAVRFVRIDGVGTGAAGGFNGFDLDAIGAINFFSFQVCGCPWDLNGDGIVDQSDLDAVVSNLGPCADPSYCPWDLDGDGVVDESDVAVVISNFGLCSMFLDCNDNGIFDALDIEDGTSTDCDDNGVPDECDIAGGASDCNIDGIPDVCEQFPTILAENTTGFPDLTFTGPPDDFFIGIGGQIVTYDFGDIVVVDGDGPDFNVYEVDIGVPQFDSIDVLVSVDGASYTSVKDTEGPVVRIPGDEMHSDTTFARSYDLGAIIPNAVRFIRIDGVGTGAAGGINGFDLDAIGAINSPACLPSCLEVLSEEVTCLTDGTTFTLEVEAINGCTGAPQTFSFTASGGAVGQEMCFTVLITDDQGGLCCFTALCVAIPDCSQPAAACDLDGDGVVGVLDMLALLAAWGTNPGGPPDFDGDGNVGIEDFLELLTNWGPYL